MSKALVVRTQRHKKIGRREITDGLHSETQTERRQDLRP